MKPIEEIISSLRIAMTDARQNKSHFESWMILNEAICDAIEALAEQPAQQEPVAVVKALPMGNNQTDMHYAECQHLPVGTLLYTSPPAAPASQEEIQRLSALVRAQQITIEKLESQRQWVGLTDEEYSQLHDGFHQQGKLLGWVLDQAEAKLREKNAQPSKPLTWERVFEIGLECANDRSRLPYEVKITRAIESAHGIKGDA